jgi:hypothetical protein
MPYLLTPVCPFFNAKATTSVDSKAPSPEGTQLGFHVSQGVVGGFTHQLGVEGTTPETDGVLDVTSSAEAFKWWYDGVQSLKKVGIDGMWNDNNEYTLPTT